eukprot:352561-Chlamydomonas_euryale.AAC.7
MHAACNVAISPAASRPLLTCVQTAVTVATGQHAGGRARRHCHAGHAHRQVLPPPHRPPPGHFDGAAARLAHARGPLCCRRFAMLGVALRLWALLLPQRQGVGCSGRRAVLLPAQDGVALGGTAVERCVQHGAGPHRAAPWHGAQGQADRREAHGAGPPSFHRLA